MTVLAHGGTAGLIVELSTVLAIVLLGLLVWVSSRKDRPDPDRDEE